MAPCSSRSTSRSVGNNFIHNSAIATVATPPNTAAVTPLSHWPRLFEALIEQEVHRAEPDSHIYVPTGWINKSSMVVARRDG